MDGETIFNHQEGFVLPAIDTLPINFAILDSNGTILWTNQAWQEFGKENDIKVRPDTTGINYLRVTEQAEDDHAQTVASGLKDILAGKQDTVEVEYPCHSPTENRWFLMRAASFTLDNTQYIAVAHFDITERIKNERELEKFQRAIETAGHAIFLTDVTREITYVNPAFEEITGYKREEAIGETPRLLDSGEMDEKFHNKLWKTISSGEVWEGMIINRRKSGALYYAHQTITPVLNSDDTPMHFVTIQTDITELRVAQKQAEKLGNILRHDLRNQLNIIQGHIDLIETGEGDPVESTEIVSQVISDLLSTVEKGQRISEILSSEGDLKLTNLGEIAQEAVETVQAEYPTASITSTIPEKAVGLSAGEMKTAIMEPIENGIIHNDSENLRVEVIVECLDDWIEVRIDDNGSGIPEKEYESLESDETSQTYHDTGFGLNMVYWIVRRSGGQLSVIGEGDDGSVVTIRLPRSLNNT